MPLSLSDRYDALAARGAIRDDAAQREVLSGLQQVLDAMRERPAGLHRLFGRKPAAPRGLYLWGNVGRGKSMLMDLFFEQSAEPRRRRVHFHAFMQEVHGRIHRLRGRSADDPVATLAQELASETRLLCFDELQVHDVTSAGLLHRLFAGLLDAGTVVVSTSNHPPASLYTGTLQAERFAKFIALIETHLRVMALSSPQDYRLGREKSLQRRYHWPLGPGADSFVDETLARLHPGDSGRPETLEIQGRTLTFRLYGERTGRAGFHALCEAALGAADYLALSGRLSTLVLTDIPVLTPEMRNEARRFINLVDALYERRVRLIATAGAPAEKLYPDGDGSFEFRRTVSRLSEMQAASYP